MPSAKSMSHGRAAPARPTTSTTSGRDAASGPESHVVHASLVRPILFAGVEPAAAALEALTAGLLLFGVGFHILTVALAVFYLTVVHRALARVAAHDPRMSELYFRSLTAHDYYAAHAFVWTSVPAAHASIPHAIH
jgi:type IV secretory pathway TrbD component